jgi:hypothetical protein
MNAAAIFLKQAVPIGHITSRACKLPHAVLSALACTNHDFLLI